jgi:hypothetical protein
MSRRRPGVLRAVPWRVAGCLAAVALFVAGCTSSSADGPTGSGGSGSSAAVSPSVADVSTSPSSSVASNDVATSPTPATIPTEVSALPDPAVQEATDRAAIESQWKKFWNVSENIIRTPAEMREAALGEVSVDPIKSRILNAANKSASEGIDYYGSVVQHPYWVDPVDGKDFAVMRDCQDQSQYGSIEVASGNKRTVGVARDSLQAGFVRDSQGVWRVQNIQFLENVPC